MASLGVLQHLRLCTRTSATEGEEHFKDNCNVLFALIAKQKKTAQLGKRNKVRFVYSAVIRGHDGKCLLTVAGHGISAAAPAVLCLAFDTLNKMQPEASLFSMSLMPSRRGKKTL